MRQFKGKRYWLVGASEGLGLALAEKLSAEGAEVIISARNADRLAEIAPELPGASTALVVDVGSDTSVASAAATLGKIDGVVFLAATYWPMTAQDWDADRVAAMCNVNFTGCARIIGAVLPQMVNSGAGHVVITGSLSGFRGLPGAIGYSASKAGVMALAEAMHADLRRSGVVVQLVNPGFIRTRLTAKNQFAMPFIMEPAEAADHVYRHMQTDSFKTSFPMVFSWVFRLSQFLPDWMYYRIFAPK